MAEFDVSIVRVLREEGGKVNDPDDPGGATNYGISLRWLSGLDNVGDFDLDGDVDADDIWAMTEADAIGLYHKYWWTKFKYERVDDQRIADSLFSFSINMGSRRAHKLTQRALLACGEHIIVDGILGPISFTALNGVSQDMVLGALKAEAACFYRGLARRRPTSAKYLKGWLKRAYA